MKKHGCNVKNTCICKGTNEPVLETEYMEKYVKHNGTKPRSPIKHTQELNVSGGPMDLVTSYRSNFVPHKVQAHIVRAPQVYKPPVAKFDGLSTYSREFSRWPTQALRPEMHPTDQLQISKANMVTRTTYTDDFKKWLISKNESTKIECRYVPPSSKFGNLTTYQSEFIPKCIAPQQICRPCPALKIFNGKFDGQTVYKLTYAPKIVEPWPRREPARYEPSSKPLDGLSVYRRDYTGQVGKPVQSFKPKPQIATIGAPFEGISEMREKFQR